MGIFDKLHDMTGTPRQDPRTPGGLGNDERFVDQDPSSFSDGTSLEDDPATTQIPPVSPPPAQQAPLYHPVIRKPTSFADAKKIALDIKENKYVTINIENLDRDTAQDLMDFVSGAMSIKNARFLKINKSAYLVVPTGIRVESEVEEVNEILDFDEDEDITL
ncbi:MAG: cell division protein SepF [Fusobacteriaceae bacterium]|jgi:cell division inhibitor SepF|nr:cell division protein SepF [Fusobacteriaceae bacterium]